MRKLLTGVSAILLAFSMTKTATAQQAEPVQANIDEIIVTAQKRAESLQDVPLSIQAITGETLVEKNVIRLDDLDSEVPNLFITEGLTGNTLNIRGIGSSQGNAGFEQSVATFTDGIYIGRSRQSIAPLTDIAQVEVLRGPQPVFFGQSAVAGALNITTKDGTGPFQGNVDLTYGEDNEQIISAGVTVPFSDKFGMRLAARQSDMDGWMTNTFTGEDWAGLETELLRATFNLQFDESFDIELRVESGSSDQHGTPAEIVGCSPSRPVQLIVMGMVLPAPVYCGVAGDAFGDRVEWNYDGGTAAGGGAGTTLPTTPASPGPPPVPATYNAETGTAYDISNPDFQRVDRQTDTEMAVLTWNYDFGPAKLTGISAYNEYDFNGAADIGGTPYAEIHPQLKETYEQTSHEVRITSNDPVFDGFLDYMVGVYYQDTETRAENDTLVTGAMGMGLENGGMITQQAVNGGRWRSDDTWSTVFAAFTGHFSDTLRGNLGLRYSEVEKTGGAYAVTAQFNEAGPVTGDAGVFSPAGPAVLADSDPFRCDEGTGGTPNGDGFVANQCETGSIDTEDLSYQLGAEYDYSDDVMLFATFTEAFKAGGLSQVLRGIASREGAFIFDDEESTNIEVGVKSILMDGKLRLNASLFTTDFENLQVSSYDVQTDSFNVQNAAAATSQGLEFDGEYIVSDDFTITFSGSLLDAEYDSFPNAQCSQYEQGLDGDDCYFAATAKMNDPTGGGGITDRAGYPLLFAPDFTINLGGRYTFDISPSLYVTLSGNVNYSDDYYVSDRYDPRSTDDHGFGGIQSAVERVDLRAEVGKQDGMWSLAVYGNNVTDERPLTLFGPAQLNGIEAGFAGGSRGAAWGVQLRTKFGG